MQYLALFAMMAMIHTSSNKLHCRVHKLSSLNHFHEGGFDCLFKDYLRGLTGHKNRGWHGKYTLCCGAPTPIANENTTRRCKFADWSTTLDR